jgi:hypothetical protein
MYIVVKETSANQQLQTNTGRDRKRGTDIQTDRQTDSHREMKRREAKPQENDWERNRTCACTLAPPGATV